MRAWHCVPRAGKGGNPMRKLLRMAGMGLAALGMTAAVLLHYTATGVRTHYVLIALLALACLMLVRRAVARVTRREACAALGFGGLLAAALLVGSAIRAQAGLLPPSGAAMLLLRWAGLTLLWGAVLACLLTAPVRTPLTPPRAYDRRFFFVAWAVILACWLPYFLFYFPGAATNDTLDQYLQVLSGTYNNHHPVAHTLLLAAVTKGAMALGFSDVAAVAIFTLLQMLGLSAFFAHMACFLRARVKARWLAYATVLLFALNPMHAYFSISLWKDIPFSAMAVWWILLIWRAVETRGEAFGRRRFVAAWVAVMLAVAFLRNNGIALLVGTLPFLIVHFKARRRLLAFTGAAVVGFYALVQGPVFSLLHIEQTRLTEALGIPLQQVAYTVYSGEALTDAQQETIDQLLPREEIVAHYDPVYTNPIKFHPQLQYQHFMQNLGTYGRLWLELGIQHPTAYLRAHADLLYRFWYPDQSVLCIFLYNGEPFGEVSALVTRPVVKQFAPVQRLEPERLTVEYPATLPLFSSGALIWYVLAACCCLWVRRARPYLLVLLPLLMLWASLMVSAPFGEARYVYALYCAVPLVVCLAVYGGRQHDDA